MKYTACISVFLFAATSASAADVKIEEHVLQKGRFINSDCKQDPSDPSYNECICDADVRYPEILGLPDPAAQAKLNEDFKKVAEKAQCLGKSIASPNPNDERVSPASVSHHYDITFQSPSILALKFTDWAYTGGAHGNGSVDGIIIDLNQSKTLTPQDVFSAKDMPGVNQVIYDTLSAKPEGEIFRDQIEGRKGSFIVGSECQGCTLILTTAGIQAVFQTYEVASFAEGNMEVPIPAKYISYKTLAHALAFPAKTASLEK